MMAQEEWRKPIPHTRISKTQKQAEDAFLDAWSEAWGEHLQQLYAQAEIDFEQEMIKDVQNIGTDQEGDGNTDSEDE
jgi:hypothetical protein